MSADNGYIIRKNDHGKYVLQMYFASNDEYPAIENREGYGYDTLEEAVTKYNEIVSNGMIVEYGLTIQTPETQKLP